MEKNQKPNSSHVASHRALFRPLIFIAYMNEIDLQKLVREMNTELELISEWLKANKLTLDIDKTYYIVFHRGRGTYKNNIEIVINSIKIAKQKVYNV